MYRRTAAWGIRRDLPPEFTAHPTTADDSDSPLSSSSAHVPHHSLQVPDAILYLVLLIRFSGISDGRIDAMLLRFSALVARAVSGGYSPKLS